MLDFVPLLPLLRTLLSASRGYRIPSRPRYKRLLLIP